MRAVKTLAATRGDRPGHAITNRQGMTGDITGRDCRQCRNFTQNFMP
jgi:hypothetical protein